MPDLEIEKLAPAALKPWVGNARTHSKKQIRQIAESIRTFGFTSPVLVDDDNHILAGHGRLAAARLLGLDAVPCVRLGHMTPEQKRAYVLADNRLALEAGWDEVLLAEELGALHAVDLDFDIAVTGFSLPEIDRLAGDPVPPAPAGLQDDETRRDMGAPKGDRGAPKGDRGAPKGDAAPEADAKRERAPARCRAGDVWWLGPHRLICGAGPDASPDACDRILRCWEAFAGTRAERIAQSADAERGTIDARNGEAA